MGINGAGTGAGGFALYVQGNVSQTAAFINLGASGATGITINVSPLNTYAQIFQYDASANVGSISVDNVSTTYNTSSDRRLKSNIAPLINFSTKIDALQPRAFTWNVTGASAIGFIADELETVIPQAVTGEANAVDKNGKPIYQGVDVSTPEMIALMVAELQSLRKRVAILEAK